MRNVFRVTIEYKYHGCYAQPGLVANAVLLQCAGVLSRRGEAEPLRYPDGQGAQAVASHQSDTK